MNDGDRPFSSVLDTDAPAAETLAPLTAGAANETASPLSATPAPSPTAVEAPAWRRLALRTARGAELLFGAVSLLVGLSLLAGTPVLQFLGLGYMLEASRRVAQSGRVRDGLVGLAPAARLGGVVVGVYAVMLPLRYLASLRRDALLIDPDSSTAQGWHIALSLLTLAALVHLAGAIARGGRLRHFFWPQLNPLRIARGLSRRSHYAVARDRLYDFVVSLRFPYGFWLGLRGFFIGLAWLAAPVTLLAAGRTTPALGWLGAALLVWVAMYLPFLQTHFAVENRLAAGFDWRCLRKLYDQAPWAHALALVGTLLFAVPLYLLKIELVSREAAWLPGLVFVLFIFPARLAVGWAYAQAMRRGQRRHLLLRWPASLLMLALAIAYAAIVFFSQYTAWYGVWSMYEQHAFLLPAPFLGI